MTKYFSYFDNFFRVPHGVFEGSWHTFLALLTEEFEVDCACLLFRVELNPEDHSALHRRPGVSAVLQVYTKQRQ